MLVAVSGGKDSLALWDLLLQLGFEVDGLYIGLGIEGYSDPSAVFARGFASEHHLKLVEVDLPADFGFDVRTGAAADHRVPCSACGLSKRHIFDRAALDGGYDVLATGHNLDDEAAVLLGNVLRWDLAYMARQRPVLPGGDGFPRKVKPLVRLGERETAAYCVLTGDRVPGRGVPDGGRQPASWLQGRSKRHRGKVAGDESRLLQRFSGQGGGPRGGSRRAEPRRAAPMPKMWRANDRRAVVCFLPAGGPGGGRTS